MERHLWNWWLIPPQHLPPESDRERYNRQQVEALTRETQKREAAWKRRVAQILEAYRAHSHEEEPETPPSQG